MAVVFRSGLRRSERPYDTGQVVAHPTTPRRPHPFQPPQLSMGRLPSLIHPSAIINPCKALFVKPIPCRGPRLPAQMQAVGCGDLLRRHGRRSTPASALCLSRSHQHSHSSSSVSFTCVVFVEKL
jgi:hypothetical protein